MQHEKAQSFRNCSKQELFQKKFLKLSHKKTVAPDFRGEMGRKAKKSQSQQERGGQNSSRKKPTAATKAEDRATRTDGSVQVEPVSLQFCLSKLKCTT